MDSEDREKQTRAKKLSEEFAEFIDLSDEDLEEVNVSEFGGAQGGQCACGHCVVHCVVHCTCGHCGVGRCGNCGGRNCGNCGGRNCGNCGGRNCGNCGGRNCGR